MIIKGKTRAHARALGRYLLSEKNDHVEVHEVRGFASTDVMGAMSELDAVSKGVKSRQPIFSVVLSPPPNESVGVEVYAQAIDRIEKACGLQGQPRIIIFHEANARRHAHAVWSRIDAEHMRVAPLHFFGKDLNRVAERTFREQGWELPKGFVRKEDRSPQNYDIQQQQQAQRAKLSPARIKLLAQEAWSISDSRDAFENALRQHGLFVAQGDRRALVVVTPGGEALSLPRLLNLKSKEVVQRLGEPKNFPALEATRKHIAETIAPALQRPVKDADDEKARRVEALEAERLAMKAAHAEERRRMDAGIAARWDVENLERAERLRKGLPGLWDRLSGRYAKLREENERAAFAALQRDRAQRQAMLDAQLFERRELELHFRAVREQHQSRIEDLYRDPTARADVDHAPQKTLRAEWLDAQRKREPATEREPVTDRAKWLQEQQGRSHSLGTERDSDPDIGFDRGYDLE